ncbi:MAG: hypothetical protein ACT4QG_06490 [Sporichthyaceae bacterium]
MIKRNLAVSGGLAALLILAGCGGGHGGDHAAPAGVQAAVDHSSMAGMDHSTMSAAEHAAMADEGDGRKAALAGYSLTKVATPKKAGRAGTLAFTIDGPKGTPHKEFVLELTKLMHVYVVRDDLTGFQHLHPELDETTGRWTAPLTVDEPGPYRLVAEFDALDPDGNLDSRRLGTGFEVPGTYAKKPFAPVAGSDGFEVVVDGAPAVGPNSLQLTVRQNGSGVEVLQPYLASWAHITGFRNGDLRAVHVHPNDAPKDEVQLGGPTLSIAPTFAKAGTYRLFVQFQTGGVVHLVPVDLVVA